MAVTATKCDRIFPHCDTEHAYLLIVFLRVTPRLLHIRFLLAFFVNPPYSYQQSPPLWARRQ